MYFSDLQDALMYLLFLSPAILFVVFLILSLVRIPKIKRREERPVKAIVFGVISTVFGTIAALEVAFILLLAAAVSHM